MKDMKIMYANNNSVLDLVEHASVPYLEFQKLSDLGIVKHGFSTRAGGVSEGIYDSMNLGYGRGDQEAHVLENFKRMGKALDIKIEDMVCGQQTHTTNVMVVDETHGGNGVIHSNQFQDIDGLITNVPGVCLTTFYADCVPLYLVDPKQKAIGLSHSGWRGTVHKIGAETIRKMQAVYGTNPEDVIVCVGPSICQKCYEVSEDVIDAFKVAFHERDWETLFYATSNGKYQLDLWRANELIFLEMGILPEHLVVTNICTCCNSEILFSHRASRGERGNLGAFLALK